MTRLRVAVSQALKAPRTRQTLCIEFRQDVFAFLFGGKGTKRGIWTVLAEKDFPKEFFPVHWDKMLDLHGQGTKIHYPVKVRHFISWSPKGFLISTSNTVTDAPGAYQEKVSIGIVKVAA